MNYFSNKNLIFFRIIPRQVVKFLFVGLLNTIVGYSLYAMFLYSGINYTLALFMTTVIGVFFNYNSLGKPVFKSEHGKIKFFKFIFVYVLSYFFNVYGLIFLVQEKILNPYVSQLLCLFPSIVFNWVMLKNWVFK